MSATPPKRQLTQLNREIEQAEAEATKLEGEQQAVAKDAARAMRRWRYLQFVQGFRKLAAALPLGPVGTMAIGAALAGILLFVLVHLAVGSFPVALLGFIFGLLAGAGAIAALLFRPQDANLDEVIAESEAQRRLQHARMSEKIARRTEVDQRLERLLAERREQVASGRLQRAALLQRNWKDMRGAEWEDFVVEVCRTLGATVERTGRIGEHDANLIVDFGDRRVAIFTEGEGQNVASATIQTAIAARERLRCGSCAVVINRRFTGAAQDFAQRNGCTAIGAGEFPDFVLGKIEL